MTIGADAGAEFYNHEVPHTPMYRRIVKAFMKMLSFGGPKDHLQETARALGISEDIVQDSDKLSRTIIRTRRS